MGNSARRAQEAFNAACRPRCSAEPGSRTASRRTSAVAAAAFYAVDRSCGRGWCAEPGDQGQNVGEHLLRYCDFGHLERDVSAVADALRRRS